MHWHDERDEFKRVHNYIDFELIGPMEPSWFKSIDSNSIDDIYLR
jgi:hypothetical protein